MSLKIGKPVPEEEVPRRAKHRVVMEEIAGSLAAGQAVPLEFDTHEEATEFRHNAGNQAQTQGLRLSLRGKTVYASWL